MTIASSALALRMAVFARLVDDAALSALLGGPRVHDEAPRAAPPPYLVLGPIETRDASGDLAPVAEHALALEVWSREGGLSQALNAADRAVRLLDGAALVLDGWRLASLDWTLTDAARIANNGFRRAVIRFRAVTEPS